MTKRYTTSTSDLEEIIVYKDTAQVNELRDIHVDAASDTEYTSNGNTSAKDRNVKCTRLSSESLLKAFNVLINISNIERSEKAFRGVFKRPCSLNI